jgi:hypothetical protein
MSEIDAAIGTVSNFIALGKELAKLPALVLPQYAPAAKDLYEICQKLLKANENLSRWFYRFRYFDFNNPNGRSEFLTAIKEYKNMKNGPEFQQLKFSCSDIGGIYYMNIESKIGKWFSDSHKMEEAKGVFARLTDADADMIAFVFDEVIGRLDAFLGKVENEVDLGNLDRAEELRLEFKSETKEIAQQLERFSDELSDLTINFAKIARVPITIGP